MSGPSDTSRRTFLKSLGIAAGAGLTFGSTACATLQEGAYDTPPDPEQDDTCVCNQPAVVRRNVATMSASDPILVAYKDAVAQMKALPASDPRSWQAQATIHNDHCPHGNWFFLPWHRAYLYYFECVVRELSGMKDWALPYWNWTQDPQIPATFFGAGNPLNNTTRRATPSSTADSTYVGSTVISNILALPTFDDFASFPATTQRGFSGYGELEGTPHNYIHGFVGGDMGTYFSPLDAIFWLHHCNVDRLWVAWNQSHANSTDMSWLDFTFPQNFYDPCLGARVDAQVKQMLSTPPLGYTYDDLSPATARVTASAPRSSAPSTVQRLFDVPVQVPATAAAGAALTVPLRGGGALGDVASALRSSLDNPADTVLRVELSGIEPPSDFVGVRVFANCDYCGADTPDNDPHFVGNFTFFEPGGDHGGHGGHGGDGTRTFYLNLAPALRALERGQRYDPEEDELDLHFVTVDLSHRATASVPASVLPKQVGLSFVEV
jgi:tyrosinase